MACVGNDDDLRSVCFMAMTVPSRGSRRGPSSSITRPFRRL